VCQQWDGINMQISILLTIFLILFHGHNLKAAPNVVATVDGISIFDSELEKSYQQNLLFLGPQRVTREKVLQDMIHRVLGIKKAKNEKLDDNPIVKEKMEDVLYHAQISKDLEQEFIKIKVTDQEVEKYYSEHKEYRTAHILFRLRAAPTPQEIDAAISQALDVYKDLKDNPDKFSEQANKYTQSTTGPVGGDLGFLPAVRLAPEYFKAIKNKNIGYITSPVRTQFGIHVIKILAVKDFQMVDKEMYKKILYDQKRDQFIDQYFQELKKKAKIKIFKEFLKED
jgi:peptidyl-prolyl cis-trans isomerase C